MSSERNENNGNPPTFFSFRTMIPVPDTLDYLQLQSLRAASHSVESSLDTSNTRIPKCWSATVLDVPTKTEDNATTWSLPTLAIHFPMLPELSLLRRNIDRAREPTSSTDRRFVSSFRDAGLQRLVESNLLKSTHILQHCMIGNLMSDWPWPFIKLDEASDQISYGIKSHPKPPIQVLLPEYHIMC